MFLGLSLHSARGWQTNNNGQGVVQLYAIVHHGSTKQTKALKRHLVNSYQGLLVHKNLTG